MRILVLGSAGMLGFALHRRLHDAGYGVVGAIRSGSEPRHKWTRGLTYLTGIDIRDTSNIRRLVEANQFDCVINAAGIIKQSTDVRDAELVYSVNALAPRRLGLAAAVDGFRLIHFSTDCVFSGRCGNYDERDIPDALDTYGASKLLGEVCGNNALTLRTSIIGRGLNPNGSLVDWFLGQNGRVGAFRRAVFSGLPVNYIGDILANGIFPSGRPVEGLYHLSADPIAKSGLLHLIRTEWCREDIELVPNDDLVIDRSLNSSRLRSLIDLRPPPWSELVSEMARFYRELELSGPSPSPQPANG